MTGDDFYTEKYPTQLSELISGGATSLHSHPGGAALPAGIICMWSGLLANIPSGWALCDGAGGRPDLRSKFIKGAAAGVEPGGSGGAATHDHDAHPNHVFTQPDDHSGVINHTHPVTDPGHTHLTQRYPTATGTSSGFTIDTSMSGTLADNTLPVKSNTTGITTTNPAGGVASLTHANGAVDAHSAHSSESNEPEYYALAFIIKT